MLYVTGGIRELQAAGALNSTWDCRYHDNSNHTCVARVSNNLRPTELGQMYHEAFPEPGKWQSQARPVNGPPGQPADPLAQQRMQHMRRLMARPWWPECQSLGQIPAQHDRQQIPVCYMPTKRYEPDLSITFEEPANPNNPQNPFMAGVVRWMLFGLIIEIHGSKDMWGGNLETMYPAFCESMPGLACLPYVFFVAITSREAIFFKIERNPGKAKLNITKETISLYPDGSFTPGNAAWYNGHPTGTPVNEIGVQLAKIFRKMVECLIEIALMENIFVAGIRDHVQMTGYTNPLPEGGFKPLTTFPNNSVSGGQTSVYGMQFQLTNNNNRRDMYCRNPNAGAQRGYRNACFNIADLDELDALIRAEWLGTPAPVIPWQYEMPY